MTNIPSSVVPAVPTLLREEQRSTLLGPLYSSGWSLVAGRDAIAKKFEFADFAQAFGFMATVAIYAERQSHHPEWFNVYNRVEVTLSTHDCGGLSQNDVDLALLMDSCSRSS